MPHRGLGVGMPIMGVVIPGALFDQIPEASRSQSIQVAGRQIAAELIHRDLKDEFGWGPGLSKGSGRGEKSRQDNGQQTDIKKESYFSSAFVHSYSLPADVISYQ